MIMRILDLFHNLRMRSKLLLLFVLTGLLPLLALSYISLSRASNAIATEVFAKNALFLELKKDAVGEFHREAEGNWMMMSMINRVYSGLAALHDKGADSPEWLEGKRTIKAFFEKQASAAYGYEDYVLTDGTGSVVFALNSPQLEGVDLSHREYMQEALRGNTAWSEIFHSEPLNRNVLIIAGPVRREGDRGDVVGAFFFFVDQKRVQEVVHARVDALGRSGDAYLLNADGLLFTDTRLGRFSVNAAMKERISGGAVDMLAPALRKGNADFRAVGVWEDYLGNSVLGSVGVVRAGNAFLGLVVEVDESEALSGVVALRFLLLLLTAGIALAGLLTAFAITRSLVAPMGHVVDLFSKLKEGDLRGNVSGHILSRKDEIGVLGRAFQELTKSLRSQIASLKETAEILASSSMQIAASISQVTAGAEETSVAVVQTTATMEEVRTTAETTHSKSREVAGIAQQGLTVLQGGKTARESLFKGMEQIGGRMTSIAETIVRLSEQSQVVGDITETVEDLAEQSNLLAVNASIEASKAGEHGRGFSVVAQEIKSLAEQSKGSVREVHRILRDIQKATSAAVMAIEQGVKAAEQGAKDAAPSKESMVAIARSFSESARSAAQIASANSELLAGIGQVAQAMESIRAAGEQNVSGMKELESASASLKETGNSLKLLVERYTV